ncbi:MAG: HD domain-containing protein [Candidatus Bathyarchaeota archaeon]|nr:HD domain-containing protein [Candidatus Bathyarchaeota archaeon]
MYEDLVDISRRHQKQVGSHGYEHTERVIQTCRVIGEKLSADMEVLIPAAILHDIAREHSNHAQKGAEMAQKILEEKSYPKIQEIVHAIEVHSFSGGGEAKTLEAQILSDVDKLDALGATGIYRAAQYGTEHDRPMEEFIAHFHEKLLTLRDLLYTDMAREIAEKRHKYMEQYLIQLDKELKGSS